MLLYSYAKRNKGGENVQIYMIEDDKKRFKACMAAAGYNITSLAKEINMTRESLSARINGKVDFGRNEMVDIAEKLNVAPSELFFADKVS